jgi:hypothetical protein
MNKKLMLIIMLSFLTLSIFSVLYKGKFQVLAQDPASLTSTIYDKGLDTDLDEDFDFLEVGVEVDILTPGNYEIYISGLEDSSYNYIYVYDYKYLFLDVGTQVVNLTLSGETIYSSGLNPSKVANIYLYNESWYWLGNLYDVPLSKEYAYTLFDTPPAYLTGTISDKGVDTDGDGKFDYLEVGVEVGVTEEGSYEVYVQGLKDSGSGYISVYDYNTSHLNVGAQFVYLNLHGPTIYSSGINPVKVSGIYLYEVQYFYYGWLGSRYDLPLSHQYFYDDFNPPFADAEAKFTVYPDGRVVMSGALNYTHLPYPNTVGFDILADASFIRTDGSTEMSANFAFIVQPQIADMFPYDGSSFHLFGTYSGGMANIDMDDFVTFPEDITSQFPLNLSDFTVIADYSKNEITGNITAPLISGVPIATLSVDFHGNLTDLYLSDDLEIVYGNFFGVEVNETVVENLLMQINSTIPGTGPGSLYEATDGILECTYLNTTMIKRVGGATITFAAHIHGDFVGAFEYFMTGGYGNPGLYWFANALVSSVETGHFELAYAKAFGEASMSLTFTANFTKLWSLLESTIPPEIPPETRAPIELLLNTTLCSVDSAQVSWTYADGRSDLHIDATIGADFNAELNFIKNIAITYGKPYPPSLWQFVNSTEVNLNNLSVTFNLTRTSCLCTIDGVEAKPPTDPVADPTQFKLTRFFNLTAPQYSWEREPPIENQRLRITVEGGYNSTHTVTIIRPSTVPAPDIASSDGTSMIWFNQSVSTLRDLIFDIKYQGVFEWDGKPYRVIFDSNSTVADFVFDREHKRFSFTATGAPGTTGYCNISIPKALLYALPQEWVIIIDNPPPLVYPTEYNVTETDTHTFIYFTYTHSTHTITIGGTEVIREFDATVLLPLLLLSTLIITLINRTAHRKKEDKRATETFTRTTIDFLKL